MATEEEIAELFFIEQQKFKEAVLNASRIEGNLPVQDTSNVKPSWEYMHTTDLNEAVSRAMELGWAEKKVQIKEYYMTPFRKHYYVEPYEEDCHCPNLLNYEDFAPNPSVIEG